jgi:hypothetical protein
MMNEHWSIEVQTADVSLSIGHNWVSGSSSDELDKHRETIIGAAKHILAFMGDGLNDEDYPPCHICEIYKRTRLNHCGRCGRSLR